MLTVVLDINCLLQIIPKRSPNRWRLITEDADDDKYADCAVAANADYLISDDRHFNVLETYDFPQIIRLRLQQAKASLVVS